MNRLELINRVKSKIDELSPDSAILVSVGMEDNKPIDTMIDNTLDEAAREILLKAPIHRLNVSSHSASIIDRIIPLPADFVRLVSLKLKRWKRGVNTLELPDSDMARRQSNKWLQAGDHKPVAILSFRKHGSGANIIEPYPSYDSALYLFTDIDSISFDSDGGIKIINIQSNADWMAIVSGERKEEGVSESGEVEQLLYIKSAKAEEINDSMIDAMCWICASRILSSLNNITLAKKAEDNAVSLMQ
jgi:hypothetical protein